MTHQTSISPSTDSDTLAGTLAGRKLVFVVTEDWFFASHFLPMARAARELGLDVAVVTRVRAHRAIIEATGARVIPLEAERRSLNPMRAGYAAGQLASVLRAEKADIVHCIALRGILIGGVAAAMAGIDRRVFALTGLGFIGARQDLTGRLAQRAIRLLTRGLTTSRTRYLFENTDDPRLLGLDPSASEITIVGGAGVDAAVFAPSPLPPASPLRIAVVARMLWSKGIDLAVEAVLAARLQGADVELSLYGAPDPSNPKAIPESILAGLGCRAWNRLAWSRPPTLLGSGASITWRAWPPGAAKDCRAPFLKLRACGRAIVTTDVPGCRTLVRDGIEGLVVRPADVPALTAAFVRLAAAPELVARMGEAARNRVLDGFTERDVMETVKQLYRDCLAA